MKIVKKKKEHQQITVNHSFDIGFNDFMKI